MDKIGGTDADVKTRIGKVRSVYNAKKGLELQRNRHIHQHTLIYVLTFQGSHFPIWWTHLVLETPRSYSPIIQKLQKLSSLNATIC